MSTSAAPGPWTTAHIETGFSGRLTFGQRKFNGNLLEMNADVEGC